MTFEPTSAKDAPRWPYKRAAAELYRRARLLWIGCRATEAGALCYAILVDHAWCARQLFELALMRHANFTPEEAREAGDTVIADGELDGDACDHCALILRIVDHPIPHRLSDEVLITGGQTP